MRRLVFILIVFSILLVYSGCSNNSNSAQTGIFQSNSSKFVRTEDQMKKDMVGQSFSLKGFGSKQYKVEKPEDIISIKTTNILSDVKEKMAQVDIAVEVDSLWETFSGQLRLNYYLYDQGWALRSVSNGTDDEMKSNPKKPSSETIKKLLIGQAVNNGEINYNVSDTNQITSVTMKDFTVRDPAIGPKYGLVMQYKMRLEVSFNISDKSFKNEYDAWYSAWNTEDRNVTYKLDELEIVSSNGQQPIKKTEAVKSEIKIPNLENTDYREAQLRISDLGLVPQVKYEFSESIANGKVINTVPGTSTKVELGASVTIVVSKGHEVAENKKVTIPDLIGLTAAAAQDKLSPLKLRIGKLTTDDTDGAGIVLIAKQYPSAGSVADEGASVDVSLVPQTRLKSIPISLDNPAKYGDTIKITVNIVPSDTKQLYTLLEESYDKSSFPVTVSIPIQFGGKTRYEIYLDDVLYKESVVQ